MPPSEIKKEAREVLKGKWSQGIVMILLYFAFTLIFGFIQKYFEYNSSVSLIINLIEFLITIPLSFGIAISFLKLKRNETTNSASVFTNGFSNFGKAWKVWFSTIIRLILPIVSLILVFVLLIILKACLAISLSSPTYSIILLIASIVLYIASIIYIFARSLLYSLANYIAFDNPSLSSKECVKMSERYMKGNRGNLLLLELSFIGWAFLSCITIGIGFIWLIPYIQISLACFYERIIAKNKEPEIINTNN